MFSLVFGPTLLVANHILAWGRMSATDILEDRTSWNGQNSGESNRDSDKYVNVCMWSSYTRINRVRYNNLSTICKWHILSTWLRYRKLGASKHSPKTFDSYETSIFRPFVLEWCSIIGSTTIGETAEERHHGVHQGSKLLSSTGM